MAQDALPERWGKAVKARRKELEMSQNALALASGLQQATISKVENGQITPADGTRIALARALSIEVGDLFQYDPVTEAAS